MKSSSREQPDQHGSLSPENAPQIVVRAGKHFICSACGVLVEIPADVVGQLVLVPAQSVPSEPDEQSGSPENPPPSNSSEHAAAEAPGESQPRSPAVTPHNKQPARPRTDAPSPRYRPQNGRSNYRRRPHRPSFVGQEIDGLRVPSAEELDLAFKWVEFHLTVLDRQGAEIKRLTKLLKNKRKQTGPPSKKHAPQNSTHPAVPPDSHLVQERGPPS